ncbi:Pyrophosphatase PpaX [bacterium HR37]|nr:Pyrophosphatase PpaX [bacterium HR37]
MQEIKLILFDIDGTLLVSGGASIRAINRVFKNMFGIENAMEGIKPDGKTDPLILRELFMKNLKRDFSKEEANRVFKEYLSFLEKEIVTSKSLRIMPGITQLIKTLSQKQDTAIGIATGNIEEGARIKLRHSGLEHFFRFGGFGSDSESREKLIRIAIERGRKLFNHTRRERVFVVGDTPFDIISAKAVGAEVIAVATGSYTVEDLKRYKPHFVFKNLSQIEEVIRVFG